MMVETKLNKKVAKKPKKKTTEPVEIVVIVDRSGSMAECQGDAEGGLNAFLDEQRKVKTPGTITLAQFDDKYDLLHDGIDVRTVSNYKLHPRGLTALYDAIGKTVTTVSERQKNCGYKGKTIVAIVTDGWENASCEWDFTRTKKLIAERKLEGWEFIFLAADEEAMQQGGQLGTVAFNANGVSYHKAYNAVSVATVATRKSGANWTSSNIDNLTGIGVVRDEDQEQG